MNTNEASKSPSAKELIEALATARARARIQLHLLSLDARDSWHELESKIDTMQAKIENDGERLSASAAKKGASSLKPRKISCSKMAASQNLQPQHHA